MPDNSSVLVDGRECSNQHDFMMAVLLAAGATNAESLKPKGADGQIADAIFPDEGWIFEIKSLDADRPNDPAVQAKLGAQFDADCKKFDGPVIFGTVSMSLEEMPGPVAHNLLRRMGNSVQEGAKDANRQIRNTKQLLGMSEAKGCVAIVSPHFDLTPDTQRWLVTDAIRGSRLSSVHAFVLCQTAMLANFGIQTSRNAMQFYDRTEDRMPRALKERIADAWVRIHGSVLQEGPPPSRTPKWRFRVE